MSGLTSALTSAVTSALSRLSLTGAPSPSPEPTPDATSAPESAPSPSASSPSAPPSADSSPPPSTAVPAGFTFACPLSSLPLNGRLCLSVASRGLLLFRLPSSSSSSEPAPNAVSSDHSRVWALDAVCYHMGGPLIEGDIEELLGSAHVVCPWHRYRISIETGEGAYQVTPGQWKSKGAQRQRTHNVRVLDGSVYVRVGSSAEGKVESDTYGDLPVTPEEVEEREKKRRAVAQRQALKMPSGMNRGTAAQ